MGASPDGRRKSDRRTGFYVAVLAICLLFLNAGGWVAFGGQSVSWFQAEKPFADKAASSAADGRERANARSDSSTGIPATNGFPTSAQGEPKGTEKPTNQPSNTARTSPPEKHAPRILDAEPAAIPVLDAKGRGRATVARAGLPLEKRWVGLGPNFDNHSEDPTCRVHGLVVELRNGDYVPLSNVIVADWGRARRTFTNNDGRFEFDAYYSDAKNSKGERPREVFLVAIKAGYTDRTKGLGQWYGPEKNDPEHGYLIVLTRAENISVTVQVDNPQLIQESVTVWMACEPHYTYVAGDEWLYVAVEADETGKAVFSIPPATFTSVGAFGKGCVMLPTSLTETAKTATETVYHILLSACDNFKAAGVVRDLRSGRPLASARVAGMNYAEVSYTDESGKFCLWLSRTPVSVGGEKEEPTLKIGCLGYMSITRRLAQAQPLPAELGVAIGGENAPWEVGMRPWVKAKGLVVAPGIVFPQAAAVRFAIDEYDMEDEYNRFETEVSADGAFSFERIPWGIEQLTLVLPGMRPGRRKLKVDSSGWQGKEPFALTSALTQ